MGEEGHRAPRGPLLPTSGDGVPEGVGHRAGILRICVLRHNATHNPWKLGDGAERRLLFGVGMGLDLVAKGTSSRLESTLRLP